MWSVVAAALIALTPMPQEMDADRDDVFEMPPVPQIVVSRQTETRLLEPLRKALPAARFFSAETYKPQLEREIYVGAVGQGGAFESRAIRKFSEIAADLPAGGYLLEVDDDYLVLIGRDYAGMSAGINTLLQWKGDRYRAIPTVSIRDYPSSSLRYVYADGRLGESDIDALAQWQCNGVFFRSSDWADLRGDAAAAWRDTFQYCRTRGIEPIPVVDYTHDAGAYLQQAPAAGEAVLREERVTLFGEDWAGLSHRPLLPAESYPVEVVVGRRAAQEGEDFEIDRGALSYPYDPGGGAALIRRKDDGLIPDGAEVTVRYAHLPPNMASVCVFAPAAETLGRGIVETLKRELGVKAVHLGFEGNARIGSDPRTPRGVSGPALLEDAITRTASWWNDEGLYPELWVSSTLLSSPPFLSGGVPGRVGNARVISTTPNSGGLMEISGSASPSLAFSAASAAVRQGGGVVVPYDPEVARTALAAAWNPQAPGLIWPRALNALFGADLWRPDAQARMAALMDFTERQALNGRTPDEVRQVWEATRRNVDALDDSEEDELERVDEQLQVLLDYLSAEYAYARGNHDDALDDLEAVIERQVELDPELGEERAQRILQTVASQRLFAPASILFGRTLRYYRPGLARGQYREVPAETRFDEERGQTRVTVAMSPGGPLIGRVDFESAGASELALMSGRRELWKATGVARGPAVVSAPEASAELTLTGSGPGERVAVREVQVFGLLPPREARAIPLRNEPSLRNLSGRDDLPTSGRVYALLAPGGKAFAGQQTEVWSFRTQGQLFFYLRAHEPRMNTVVADEESVTIDLMGGRYRLVLHPDGTHEASWDAAWSAEISRGGERWEALVAVPFFALGEDAAAVRSWPLRVERARRNVVDEDSVWSGTLAVE